MDSQRRHVLKAGLGFGVTTTLASSVMGATQTRPSQLEPPDQSLLKHADWATVRQLFSFEHQAPLNAANLCPTFAPVLDRQQHYTQVLNRDVSMIKRRDFVLEQVKTARQQCARMLGISDPDNIAFLRNTSEANAIIVNGLNLKSDDEVLLWEQNHATNYQSWHYRGLGAPHQCRRLVLPQEPESKQELVEAFLQQVTAKTRVVSFSHISNISGLHLPAREICHALHDKNPDIFIHIDGAQSWGSLALDLEAIGCDSYAASGHKWLCGPRGCGILMVKPEWAQRIQPLINGYNFVYDYPENGYANNALRFENIGQRDTAVYGALADTVDLHLAIGSERIEARIQELTQYGLRAFDRAGMPTLTPKTPQLGHGVLVADLGHRFRAYAAFLALHNAGYAAAFVHGNHTHCSPTGFKKGDASPVYLRLCPHIYNDTSDLDEAIAIARRIKDSSLEIVKELIRFL